MLALRLSGTTLLTTDDQPAMRRERLFGGPDFDATFAARTFRGEGEPGPLLDAYRAEAEASGWVLDRIDCSRMRQEVRAAFDKRYPAGVEALLSVKVTQLPAPVLDVNITVTAALKAPPEEARVLVRHDAHCLDGMEPSDDRPAVPGGRPRTSLELCRLLTVQQIRALVPFAVRIQPAGEAGQSSLCAFVDATGAWAAWIKDSSVTSRFMLDDTEYPSSAAPSDIRLMTYPDSDELAGAWVGLPDGALYVQLNTSPRVEDLVDLARAVSAAATP